MPRRKVFLVLVREASPADDCAAPAALRPGGTDDASSGARPSAFVVLGCRVSVDAEGRLQGALGRRARAAASAYLQRGDAHAVVVVSGGRRWSNVVEADALALELARLDVPARAVVRERCSLSTRDNARFAARVLARRGIARATVVTCDWHLPRAVALFGREGMEVEGLPVSPGSAPWTRRLWRWGRERVLAWAQLRPS
jgi:uncharacterized SAM-binding protein YcdF (DUF218 family)